jgi:uroporphyrinogen-III synthase
LGAKALSGRGIVVTRPRELAATLAGLIEREGGRAIRFPAIEIEDLPPPAALSSLERFDLAIFISPTAAARVMSQVGAWPKRLRTAAVGAGTRRELERRGLAGVLAPEGAADSEALLALPELAAPLGKKRVVIFRGGEGRRLLGDALAARGAQVEYAECYRRRRPVADATPLLEDWERGAVHAVTVSSSEGLDNLVALLGARGAARLRATPLFVPHARVAAHAAGLGMQKVVVAGPGDDAVLERLVGYFHEHT